MYRFHVHHQVIVEKLLTQSIPIDRLSIKKKQTTTIIVNTDDKNCLAQTTVAQKLNQDVWQWLYIIAGRQGSSFFYTSKRKNIQLMSQ